MKKTVGVLVSKSNSKNISSSIVLPDIVNSPVYEGQKLGEITYSIDNKIVSTVNLVAKSSVKKLNFPNMCAKVLGDWFNLLR